MAYHSIPGSGFHYPNSPFGDTTYTKVFVGGLAWETQSETLRRHFEHFGEILEAVVITDKNTGRSKGYGFVSILLLLDPMLNSSMLVLLKTALIVFSLLLVYSNHKSLFSVRFIFMIVE